MDLPRVTLTGKGLSWYRTGHPWIYRDDLAETGAARPGDIVAALDGKGRLLGKAFYGGKSKIALRLLTRRDEPVDDSFWRRRIADALARRGGPGPKREARRLVYSEGDLLPGLIADRYADWLVVQALVPGTDARLGTLAALVAGEAGAAGIVARNDASSRSLECLPREKKLLRGEEPGLIEVEEGDIRYLADIWNGQKTGAYCDQRENRSAVARHARGRVLDCFSYQGHFALHAARRAESVIAVESSGPALEIMKRNIALNGADTISPLQENVFDALRRFHRKRERFDMIILDPPPLARRKANVQNALRGYKEINLRAMHCLNRGGRLASFCCSHGIARDLFMEILRAAAADARAAFRVVEELRQPADHPVLLNAPETAYLKGFILEKD